MNEATDILRKKLKFRSWHRGCKETDLILGHFSDRYLEGMSAEELEEFAVILDLDDADLYRWYTGEQAIPANLLTPMLEKVMAFDIHALLQAQSSRLATPSATPLEG